MWEFIQEHFGDILLAIEIFIFAMFGKVPFGFKSKNTIKSIAKQEKKVARDYEKLKADESALEELKKGGEE